jgi:hypothetical protein
MRPILSMAFRAVLTIPKELPRRSRWVFANGSENRYTHMWDDAKAIGKKARIPKALPEQVPGDVHHAAAPRGMDLKSRELPRHQRVGEHDLVPGSCGVQDGEA